MVVTVVILRITWQSYLTVRADPGAPDPRRSRPMPDEHIERRPITRARERRLREAPARVANTSRNANAGRGRHRRWEAARDALWDFVAPVVDEGARVAIVGAGNCDTVPLPRLIARADEVVT